jgi:hypothetical protein
VSLRDFPSFKCSNLIDHFVTYRNNAGSTASLQRRIRELENHLLAVQARPPSPLNIQASGSDVPNIPTSRGSIVEADLVQMTHNDSLHERPPPNSSPSWKIQRVSREGIDEFRSVTNYPLDLDSTLNGIRADIDVDPQPLRQEPFDEESVGQEATRSQGFGHPGDMPAGRHSTRNQMYREADDLQPNKKRRKATDSSDGRSRFDQEAEYGERASSASRNNDSLAIGDPSLKSEPSRTTARLVAEILTTREIEELYKQ